MKKENIFKILLITFIAFNLFNALSADKLVLAADYNLKEAAEKVAEGGLITTPQKIFDILVRVLRYVYTIFFVVAAIFIIVAAFNFLTAKGDPEKIKGARSQILWAVVAIVIGLISIGATQIITTFIEGAK